MVKIHDEPESPHEGACLRHHGIAKYGGVFKVYVEPEPPNERAVSDI